MVVESLSHNAKLDDVYDDGCSAPPSEYLLIDERRDSVVWVQRNIV